MEHERTMGYKTTMEVHVNANQKGSAQEEQKNKRYDRQIRIWGNQNLELEGSYNIKDYMKDHRIMAMATISALTLGGNWKIYDKNSINTSFPDFIKILKNIGAKFVE